MGQYDGAVAHQEHEDALVRTMNVSKQPGPAPELGPDRTVVTDAKLARVYALCMRLRLLARVWGSCR